MAPYLPVQREQDKGKPTLVLDLDETLVSVASEGYEEPAAHMTKRPGLDEFLVLMALKYELVVFSASEEAYVNQVVDALDPEGQLIAFRLSGEYVDRYDDGSRFKDLRKLGRDLQWSVWVDDNAAVHAHSPLNGFQVPAFHGDEDDCLFRKLGPKLMSLEFPFTAIDTALDDS